MKSTKSPKDRRSALCSPVVPSSPAWNIAWGIVLAIIIIIIIFILIAIIYYAIFADSIRHSASNAVNQWKDRASEWKDRATNAANQWKPTVIQYSGTQQIN